MNAIFVGCGLVVVLSAVIYVGKAWTRAQQLRDVDFMFRPGAGIVKNEQKPSAVPYLFK